MQVNDASLIPTIPKGSCILFNAPECPRCPMCQQPDPKKGECTLMFRRGGTYRVKAWTGELHQVQAPEMGETGRQARAHPAGAHPDVSRAIMQVTSVVEEPAQSWKNIEYFSEIEAILPSFQPTVQVGQSDSEKVIGASPETQAYDQGMPTADGAPKALEPTEPIFHRPGSSL